MSQEKRVDPSDGQAYTLAEMSKFYAKQYDKKGIKSHFDNCKPLAAPKAKAKAKVKAKAKKAPKPQKMIKVGDQFPDVELDVNFPPEKVKMLERLKGKKVVILGLPGAFTTC
mmetsp:Transcript_87949/g.269093  ORF Transcript_87949/g.269093 Transcript_87949/m.269093 type:complete len:112 (-) Transcript_87949:444-779(-)